MRRKHLGTILPVLVLTASSVAAANEESKTVLGPSNIYLYDGANALKAGNGEDGVRLTLLGLQRAQGAREEKIAHANLCAGFILVDQPKQALEHCNWVIERDPRHWRTYNNRALAYLRLERFAESEEDVRRGQELRPGSEKLKIVKGMVLDETRPVTPKIEIDERRKVQDDANPEQTDDVAN
ncbi:MAG: hypothetical protein ACR2RD_04145 [Woeseiaceae bacterium]